MTIVSSSRWFSLTSKLDNARKEAEYYRSQLLSLETIFQTAPIGLACIDSRYTVLSMNRHMMALSEASHESQPGTPLSEIFPSLATNIKPDLQSTLEANEYVSPIEFRVSARETQETFKDCLATFSLIRGSDGKGAGIMIAVQEISEKKRLEEKVRTCEETLQQATKIGKFIVYEWDLLTGKVIRESGMSQLLGPHAMPGTATVHEWRKMVHPVDLENLLKRAELGFSSAAPSFEDEYRILNSQNEYIYIWDRGVILRDENDRPAKVIGVSIDIDARKKLEEKLRQYSQKLAEADRRKDEFIAMMSHELRNPLMPINTGIAILSQLKLDNEVANKAVGLISRQVAHMSRLIEDLLDISRITKGTFLIQRQRLNFTDLVRSLMNDYSSLIQAKGISFHGDVPEYPLWIEGDETRLTQAFGNILHNSLKYTPQGGSIDLNLSTDNVQKQAIITIRDSGVGISQELLPHIFNGFAQASQNIDRSKGGLGLGLTLVKFIVDRHDGEIAASSPGLNQGSQFVVKIPLIQSESLPAQVSGDAVDKKCRRVLIIEDQPDIVAVLQLFIQDILGLDVITASDASAGLQLARTKRPDVIICDIGLPGEMNGYDFAKAVRSAAEISAVKLIALTGYGTEGDKRKSLEAGFDQHMTKPPNLDWLQAILTSDT
jgi:PAS domain S-box-containing protein